MDISIYFDLPTHISKRISEEGKVLYTKDMYHLPTLFKENYLEYHMAYKAVQEILQQSNQGETKEENK